MTTNQTIDGVLVSRDLLERLIDRLSKAQMFKESTELRALLDAPAPTVDGEQWYADTPDGDSALVTRVAALCKHPSMSFHQVALLEGAISDSKTAAQPQPDPMLCRFYDVADWSGLVRELVGHVAQLQESAKRNVKPWEDTFPPKLLPAYIERVNTANSAAPPQGDGVNWKGVADQQKGIIEQQQNLIASLRAELAESYRIDSKLNGEPVHMVRSHGSCCWEEMSGESLEMCQAQPGEYEVRTLYAEQPALVADPLAKGFTTLESDSGKYKIVTSFATRDDAWSAYRALLGAKPAPVSVVLPERAVKDGAAFSSQLKVNGWNACLDEVARLNAAQPVPVAAALPVNPERERLMEIVQQYPNVDPLKYDAAVRTLRK